MTVIVDPVSILAIDFGSLTTRATLFDAVNGQYRFVAMGSAATTAQPPFLDLGEGLHRALDELSDVSGRKLLDDRERLIVPSRTDGSGVDTLVATASVGPAIRAVIAGLTPDVSLDSARRLAASNYVTVVDELRIGERRRPEQQIDVLVAARPDLIIVAGGTEGGASDAVLRLMETVGLAAHLLPAGHKPQILFAGNSEIAAKVTETLQGIAEVKATANIRPTLDEEDLTPARAELAEVFERSRAKGTGGFEAVAQLAGGRVTSTAQAYGQLVRFLSRKYDPGKGVLGVDLGANSTVLAAGFAGDLALSVRPDLGLGESAAGLLAHSTLGKVIRWLPADLPEAQVLDYIYNKRLYPRSIPADLNEMHIEMAMARELLRSALRLAGHRWPAAARRLRPNLLPLFEPILGRGAVLAQASRPGRAAMILVDGLQPVGVTTLALDPYAIAPALGAVAAVNPLATVQVLESSCFTSLGTVIAPVGQGRPGELAVRLKLTKEAGHVIGAEVPYGSLEVIPLPGDQEAELAIVPAPRFDVGFGGPGKGQTLRIRGGALGVVVDARGRPLRLSDDAEQRIEANQKWLWAMGG